MLYTYDLIIKISVSISLIIVPIFALIQFYIKSKIVSDLDEKTQVKIKHLETNLELMFRNEVIRKKLAIHTTKQSIKVKTELFYKINEDYSLLKDALRHHPIVPKDKVQTLIRRYEQTSDDLTKYSIFLGGTLSELLINISKNILASLHERKYLDAREGYADNVEFNNAREPVSLKIIERDQKIQELLLTTRNYLVEILHPDQDIKRYDFNKEQSEVILKAGEEYISKKFKN